MYLYLFTLKLYIYILSALVGSSFERWVKYHRVMGRLTVAAAAAHGAAAAAKFGWAVTSAAPTCFGEGGAGRRALLPRSGRGVVRVRAGLLHCWRVRASARGHRSVEDGSPSPSLSLSRSRS